MSIAALIRQMAAAGAPAEAIAIAVEAIEGAQAEVQCQRAAEAARSRRYRERGGGNIPEELRQAVFQRDGHACRECGSADFLQCDHVYPVSRGGETALDNLQTLCRVCNARKKDRVRKADVRGNSTDIHGQSAAAPASPSSLPPRPPNLTTPTPPVVTTRTRQADAFEVFWEAYPRKTAKHVAEKAFPKAIASIDAPDPLAVMLAGIARDREGRQWRQGVIPHASTWLNQKRWQDEPETGNPDERHSNSPRQADRDQRLSRMLAGAMEAVDRT